MDWKSIFQEYSCQEKLFSHIAPGSKHKWHKHGEGEFIYNCDCSKSISKICLPCCSSPICPPFLLPFQLWARIFGIQPDTVAGAGLVGLGATAAHLGAGKAPAGWGLDSFPTPLTKQLLPWSPAFLCSYLPVQGKAINVICHKVIHRLQSCAYAKQALLLEWESPYQEWAVKDFFLNKNLQERSILANSNINSTGSV